MEVDLVIRNGVIIDGTGRKRFKADLGIRNGRIAVIVPNGEESPHAQKTLDASGKVVAPGFVDINSHADWVLPQPDHAQILAPLLLQGVTTVVGGNCGYSAGPILPGKERCFDQLSGFIRDAAPPFRWGSFTELFNQTRKDGLLLNAAYLIGQNTLRQQVMEDRSNGPATTEDLDNMKRVLRQALRDGAVGFSGNLGFSPGAFARRDELLALLQVVRKEGGIFPVHARAYTWISKSYRPMLVGGPHNLRAVRELIDLTRQTGVRLQISHLSFGGRRSWRTYRAVLKEINLAAEQGVDIGFDAFSYPVGGAPIQIIFPEWFLDGFLQNLNDPKALKKLKKERMLQPLLLGMAFGDVRLVRTNNPELKELEGLDFKAIGGRLGMAPAEAQLHVARSSQGNAMVLIEKISGDERNEEALQAVLRHPLCAFITNSFLQHHGCQNPASFGNFPRVLGRYSRDLGLFPLEEAVRRMTSYPAERFGFREVGRIKEGFWADLCIFDPQTVKDNGWPQRSDQFPTGVHAVLISGELAAYEGQVVPGVLKGRVLTRD